MLKFKDKAHKKGVGYPYLEFEAQTEKMKRVKARSPPHTTKPSRINTTLAKELWPKSQWNYGQNPARRN